MRDRIWVIYGGMRTITAPVGYRFQLIVALFADKEPLQRIRVALALECLLLCFVMKDARRMSTSLLIRAVVFILQSSGLPQERPPVQYIS